MQEPAPGLTQDSSRGCLTQESMLFTCMFVRTFLLPQRTVEWFVNAKFLISNLTNKSV